MSAWLAVIGLLVGLVLGAGAVAWWARHRLRQLGPELLPADTAHVIDLLRRAHGATAACLVLPEGEPLVSVGDPRPSNSLIERAVASANLALGDSREHVMREGNVIVAVGDGHMGSAVVLAFDEVGPEDVQVVAADLRRFLAELSVERRREFGALADPTSAPDWITAGSESVEAIGFALCESVRAVAGRATAVVVRDPSALTCSVAAVSHTADRRLLGLPVTTDSAAGRACAGDIPVAGGSPADLFGSARTDRRRRTEIGLAFPLRDGPEGVGALIVFGPADTLDPAVRERVMGYAVDAGPRLSNAIQVRVAENRAMTDELTRLPNRRALDRALSDWGDEQEGALLCVDIDLFKKVNDDLGHAAGDAALKHIARIFRQALREGDVAARMGGEEFAIWLPHTPLAHAVDVAERIRKSVETSVMHWGGSDVKMTCSVGVSGIPETVTQVANLFPTADSALYRAKSSGRNRVETAEGTGSQASH
jgi:diguanylate cyclase (GGDEF)-like protein